MALLSFLVLYLRLYIKTIALALLGKLVPEDAVLEMKFNYSLPDARDEYVDDVIWIELDQQEANEVVKQSVLSSSNDFANVTRMMIV